VERVGAYAGTLDGADLDASVLLMPLAGERDRAGQLFEDLAARGNDLGLFVEQVDPFTGEPLGNFPQAFSHIGLINAAGGLSEVDRGTGGIGAAPERLLPRDS
jgi:hypothetical protein